MLKWRPPFQLVRPSGTLIPRASDDGRAASPGDFGPAATRFGPVRPRPAPARRQVGPTQLRAGAADPAKTEPAGRHADASNSSQPLRRQAAAQLCQMVNKNSTKLAMWARGEIYLKYGNTLILNGLCPCQHVPFCTCYPWMRLLLQFFLRLIIIHL